MTAQLRDLLPLHERDRDQLLSDTRDLVIASVGAGLAVAAAQGTVGGVAFWLLGLGAPVFWGVVLAFCSLIPVVGAALVWAPAGLWLLLSGETGRGVGMLVVGVLGISMVDNVLRPLLLSGRTQVNGLVIFFGLLGGAAAFGFIGLVIGPIILVTTGRLLGLLLRPVSRSHSLIRRQGLHRDRATAHAAPRSHRRRHRRVALSRDARRGSGSPRAALHLPAHRSRPPRPDRGGPARTCSRQPSEWGSRA